MEHRDGTLVISIGRLDADRARLSYDYGPQREPDTAPVELSTITDMLQRAKSHYYARLPEDPDDARRLLVNYGRKLFEFLDTPQRRLSSYLDETRGACDVRVLALETGSGFAHLPWELLHDGREFLVASANPVAPVRKVPGTAPVLTTRKRPLRIVFMACDPEQSGGVLDCDDEEARIWDHTRRFRVDLEVEDSGELSELRHRVLAHDRGDVDVVHLTGHAVLTDGVPRFLTEGTHGEQVAVGAGDLHEAFFGRPPSLVFLSGCRSAESAEDGAVASLAESLASSTAPLVLGWGRPVPDAVATLAAATFYQQLAEGLSPAVALAGTYRQLVRDSVPYWHLLRMFVRGEVPGPLVAPPRTAQRDRFTGRRGNEERAGEPLDRLSFVGRRREVQWARRLLDFWDAQQKSDGLVLHGLGGIGKTALANRLVQRLCDDSTVHCLWLRGDLDGARLLSAIRDDPLLAPTLGDVRPELSLRHVLRSFLDRAPQLLIVLDEFELNYLPDRLSRDGIELVDGRPSTRPEAAAALTDLVEAVHTSRQTHRLVITTRYLPALDCIRHLETKHLVNLRPFEVDRLVDRLNGEGRALDPSVVGWARRMSGDNPRLLTWLLRAARGHVLDHDRSFGVAPVEEQALLELFRGKRDDFLERSILAPMLLGRIETEARVQLEAAAPIRTPVPAGTHALLTRTTPAEAGERAGRLAGLGLLESVRGEDGSLRFQVPLLLGSQLALPDPRQQRRRVARCAKALVRLLGDDFLEVPDARLLDHDILKETRRLALAGHKLPHAVNATLGLALVELAWRRFSQAAALCREMLGQSSDHRLYLMLGVAENELGHAADADLYVGQALELCPPDNPRDRAQILAQSAVAASRRNQDLGRRHAEEAVELARQHGSDETLVVALCALALHVANRGVASELDVVPALFEEAMNAARRVRDRGQTATTVRFNQAVTRSIIGDDPESVRTEFRAVIAAYEHYEMPLHQAVTILELAVRLLELDPPDPDEAEQLVQQVIRLNQRLRSAHVEASVQFCLGAVASSRNAHDSAIDHYRLARERCREMGDELLEFRSLDQLANTYWALGDTEGAAQSRREAHALNLAQRNPWLRIDLLLTAAEAERQLSDHDAAAVLDKAREAALLARANDDPQREMRAWDLFADEAATAPDAALEHGTVLERLLELCRASDDRTALPLRLTALGGRLLADERFLEARSHLTEALALAEAVTDHATAARAHELLGSVAQGTGDGTAAEERLRLSVCHWLAADQPYNAALVLRQLATAQRPHASADARWSLMAACALARALPSAVLESQLLGELAQLAEADGADAETDESAAQSVEAFRRLSWQAEQRGAPLRVLISSDMVEHFDPDGGALILHRVSELRDELQAADGWTLPPVNIQDTEALHGCCTISVWGDVAHTLPLTGVGDPVTRVVTDLRTVVHQHRTNLDAGEPAPPADPLVEDISVADIRARLGCPVAPRS
ncbi:CHAT domain-containing protein [Streptomyces endophyticus]|uniref:CHAT domain-containing protein n=1 Tax=Streptomyces endophyticus TaxID=714166 RepID=A0ABU6FET8_9ACTN|nr:CHAT domain-containing protein [Streptomyces endophyticus]MEB8342364.1 CHAT domain-containing protein [Streptomyces endophyticus]